MILTDITGKDRGKRRLYDILFFSFIATFISALENMFPRPLPYFRIGFAFVIIILLLDGFNIFEIMLLILIKNVTVSLIFAYIFTAPFYLGLTGGMASVIVMKIMMSFKSVFSVFGISVLGSLVSNITQGFMAEFLFSLPDVKILLPFIIIFSLISGSIVGVFSLFFYVLRK